MSTLSGNTPSTTFKDLLQVSNSNSGVDATLRDVEDGEGTVSALKLSTTHAQIPASKTLDITGSLEVGGTDLTKGGIVTGTGAGAVVVLAVGSDDEVVVADSATANGVKWAKRGWVPISVASAASSSAMGILGGIDSTYDEYKLVLNQVRPVTDNDKLQLRVAVSSAWQTGANDYEYNSAFLGMDAAGFANGTASQGATQMVVSTSVGNQATEAIHGEIKFFNPAGATNKPVHWDLSAATQTGVPYRQLGGGVFNGSTSAINGVQVYFASGAIVDGSMALYGFAK